jgi:hypothetical protein
MVKQNVFFQKSEERFVEYMRKFIWIGIGTIGAIIATLLVAMKY